MMKDAVAPSDAHRESMQSDKNSNIVKLLVLAPSLRDTSPGSRFRIEQWMGFLAREGFECTYEGFEDEALHEVIYREGLFGKKAWGILKAFGRRLRLMSDIQKYDAVFIYEEASRIGPAIVERLIHRAGVPMIYDFCDPVYMPYKSRKNSYLSYLKFFGKTATICRLSAQVLVGNRDLEAYARQHNANVTIVPITIDLAEYGEKLYSAADERLPVIGWTGSHSTLWFLEEAGAMLRELRKEREYELRVMGGEGFRLEGVSVRTEPWRAEREVPFLHECDIGIMPIADFEWARLRSHLKVRQYMAVGMPCVATPVGVIADLIQDGVNGFLASSQQEWVQKLTALLDDPELRRRMGKKARKRIAESCAAEPWAHEVGKIIRSAVSGGSRGERESQRSRGQSSGIG
jgi:glycosyltransferase involved in cell wall biosynthesis